MLNSVSKNLGFRNLFLSSFEMKPRYWFWTQWSSDNNPVGLRKGILTPIWEIPLNGPRWVEAFHFRLQCCMNCSKQQKKELILNNNLRLIDFMLKKEIIVSPLFSQHVFAGLFLFILRSSYFCLKEFKTLKNRQQPSGNEAIILLCGILIMN